jgi:hypothetical protein
VNEVPKYLRATRQVRKWERLQTEFVNITIECTLDTGMNCQECRYFDVDSNQCQGVGTVYYLKQVPSPD